MADTYRDLDEYLALANSGRDGFIARNPHPFLVRLPDSRPVDIDPWKDDFSYATRVPGLVVDDDDEGEDRSAQAVVIVPVRKRPGGPFPMRIGLGRARNCDVCLRFVSVSKLHAQFYIDTQPWSLIDLESANGTFIGGKRLPPRVPTPVEIGAQLQFGSMAVELMDAGTLFDRLATRKR